MQDKIIEWCIILIVAALAIMFTSVTGALAYKTFVWIIGL